MMNRMNTTTMHVENPAASALHFLYGKKLTMHCAIMKKMLMYAT